MKVITPTLATHMGGTVTTLATLWKVKRTDGTILGFTDHDQDIVYNARDGDGAITYFSAIGFTPSAADTQSEMGASTLQVTAFLDVSAITDVDLRAGLYNFCSIELRLVNYADLTQGEMKLRKGTVGNVSLKNGIGQFEIRGLGFRLGTVIGSTFGPTCRAELGDVRCRVNLDPATISTLIESSNSVTVVLAASFIGLSVGNPVVIAGTSDSNYDGTFLVDSIISPTSFTYTNPIGSLSPATGGTAGLQQSGIVTSVADRRTISVSGLVGSGESISSQSVGPLFPSTVFEPSEVAGASGDDGWQDESNAKTNNASFAIQRDSTSTFLRATGFNANLPLNVFVVGIKTTIRRKALSTDTKDVNVRLVSGNIEVGQDKADLVNFWPTVNTDKDYGGPSDLWQTTATPRDINDPDFGMELKANQKNVAFHSAEIDSFSMTIYYQLVRTGYFSDGILTFTSGANNGFSMEIMAWDGTTLSLFEGMPFDVMPGDTFVITPGCDLTINDCQNKFVNIVNNRSEPFIPGMDSILNYPNADGSIP
jgi:hypothetical protein